jgi:hypothetical protein
MMGQDIGHKLAGSGGGGGTEEGMQSMLSSLGGLNGDHELEDIHLN